MKNLHLDKVYCFASHIYWNYCGYECDALGEPYDFVSYEYIYGSDQISESHSCGPPFYISGFKLKIVDLPDYARRDLLSNVCPD